MSSRAMPLATRDPRNGGVKTGLSAATVGARGGATTVLVDRQSGDLRGGSLRPPCSRPKAGSSSPVFLISTRRSMVRSPSKASLP